MLQNVDYGMDGDAALGSPEKGKARAASDGEFDDKEPEASETEQTEEESDFESKRPTVKGKNHRARAKAP